MYQLKQRNSRLFHLFLFFLFLAKYNHLLPQYHLSLSLRSICMEMSLYPSLSSGHLIFSGVHVGRAAKWLNLLSTFSHVTRLAYFLLGLRVWLVWSVSRRWVKACNVGLVCSRMTWWVLNLYSSSKSDFSTECENHASNINV